MAASPNQRNWKGIIIALCCIATILAIVAVSVVILTPEPQEPRVKGERFQISHILDPIFNPSGFNGTWISGRTPSLNKYIFFKYIYFICVHFLGGSLVTEKWNLFPAIPKTVLEKWSFLESCLFYAVKTFAKKYSPLAEIGINLKRVAP